MVGLQYLPCPVDANGVQQSCDDLPTAQLPAGWQPVDNMTLHMDLGTFELVSIKLGKW